MITGSPSTPSLELAVAGHVAKRVVFLWPSALRDGNTLGFLARISGHAGQSAASLTPTTNSTASFTPGTSSESTGVGSL